MPSRRRDPLVKHRSPKRLRHGLKRLYLRILADDPHDTPARMREVLESAPGVARVDGIEPHGRGGHSVFLIVMADAGEPLFVHLAAHGLRGAL